MKKAKKYIGRKIRITSDFSLSGLEKKVEELNIINSLKSFKILNINEDFDTCELLKDDIILYKCDIRKVRDLPHLCDIRNHWAKGKFKYNKFCTKKEIEELLENNYCVAVEGLQEIDLEDLDKLESERGE